jgi:SAM-dependent methyltransferase
VVTSEKVSPFDGRAYQERFDTLSRAGMDVHGEARLVMSLAPRKVLDAGCGTGRVAIELAQHGIEVVGVDVDSSMISEARRRAPDLVWIENDLAELELGCGFDVVVLAGNVPIFCPAERRAALVERCAEHVDQGGFLVAGFRLGSGFSLEDYDRGCSLAGLTLYGRWATWEKEPFGPDSSYAVSLHTRLALSPEALGLG